MTFYDPWTAGAAAPAGGLSSSLGGPSSAATGTYDPWAASAAAAAPPKSHDTGLFGSITNPFGLTSAVKNMAGGLASSFGSLGYHAMSGLVDTGYNAMASATGQHSNWSQVGKEFGAAGQGVGDMVGGIGLGLEDLTVGAANIVGLQNVMRDDVWRPVNHWMGGNESLGTDSPMGFLAAVTHPFGDIAISQEMSDRLKGNGNGKGYGPEGFFKEAQQQGIGGASLNAAAEAAVAAGPIAGAASGMAGAAGDAAAAAEAEAAAAAAADTAAGAATSAETEAALGRASALRARADTLDQVANTTGTVAHAVHRTARFGFNPFGAVGELAANRFGSMADESLANAPEGEVPDSAKYYRRAANLGQLAHSPLQFIGMNAADLLSAIREQTHPTILPPEGTSAPSEAPAAQTATQGVSEQPSLEEFQAGSAYAPGDTPVTAETLGEIRHVQNPQTAAAEGMGQSVQPDTRSELQQAMDAAVAAEEKGSAPAELRPVEPGFTRVYRGEGGEGNAGEGADAGRWGSPSESHIRAMYADAEGRIRYQDVPNSVIEGVKAEGSDANGNLIHPETDEIAPQVRLPNDYSQSWQDHPEANVPTEEPQGRQAPKAEPQIEPDQYNVTKNQPPMPVEEQAARQAALDQETAAAREKMTPKIYVYDKLGQRLNAPTPIWAQTLAEKLPDAINRPLSRLAPFIEETRLRNLVRAMLQATETSQQMARTDPAMRTILDGAAMILDRSVTRSAASDMVGQEVFARAYGEQALVAWLGEHNDFMPSQDQQDKLTAAARGRYKGIPPEVWDKLSPEDKVTLQGKLDEAAKLFKEVTLKTRETLLASRYGAKGLENTILDPNDPGMTREMQRLYARSMRDMRFEQKALERVPEERARAEAKQAMAEATGERKWGVVDRLRKALGLTEATTDELYRGIPDGMRNNADVVVNASVDAMASGLDHVVIDPATGSLKPPDRGVFVPMALQGPGVLLADWATQGADAVRNAIMFPMSAAGRTYDPVRLFTSMDARIVLARVTDGDGNVRIQPMLGMHSINGTPIEPWQARILGDAFGQNAGYSFSDGKNVPFSGSATQQVISQWYVGDVLDQNSSLTRWASQKAAAAQEVGIGPEQVSAEISFLLTLDQVMAQRDNGWKSGDIFKTETAVGKGAPTSSSLLQTIMPELSTMDHFNRALVEGDFDSVNKALAWYYTSHDAIESMWRYNEDGSVKMTPFGRSAAETFYDLIAVSSVMANPTQNLGRAIAGYANLDEFLQGRQDAMDNAEKVMNEIMGNRPNDVVYVKNLGVSEEDWRAANPQMEKESTAAYNRRMDRGIERQVGKGEGGTAVSRRWLGSIGDFDFVARKLSAQTSMTTSPKYRIIDILMGKLDLSTAGAEEIGKQPEWWMHDGGTNYSDAKLAPSEVLKHADLLGAGDTQTAQDYQDWAVRHANLKAARLVREDPNWVKPITDSEDVQRQRAEADAGREGKPILGGREVGPQEYQNLALDGKAYVERALASSSPHVLDTPEARQSAWDALHPTDPDTWPGGTFDAHTGQPIPGDYRGDTYAVSAKIGNMKTVTTPLNATPKQFDAAYTKALRAFGPVLNSEGGHLGIFENHDTGVIEFDPVYHTQNVADTEAVGAYTHAHGGAYNFVTKHGYWIPHVRDELTWSVKSGENGPARSVAKSVLEGRGIAKSPELRQAYENALMEYHGSALLAKLRSFRDNLADPHNSLAVTLDSIMAQLWGIEGTPWSTKNEYATYADQIRDVARVWSQIAGRTVMPHEVQAALWVYTKSFIGTQDWGRWNAHLTKGLSYIDDIEKVRKAGYAVKLPSTTDLLSEAWKEELQFSRDHLAVRTERTPLREAQSAFERGKGPALTPEQSDRLAYLEQYPGRRTTEAMVQRDGEGPQPEQRDETYYDANTLRGKEDQYVAYLTKYADPIHEALANDNFDKARNLLREYVVGRQKSMLAGIDGDAFDAVLRKSAADPSSVTFQSLARLEMAKHVPHPNVDGLTRGELESRFLDRIRGATLEHPNSLGRIMMRLYQTADFTTLLHEDLHAFRLMAPGDEVAKLSEEYPHIQDATMTPERRADEERFVEDVMKFMYDRARAGDPRLSPAQRSQVRYNGPLKDLFNNVADAIDEVSRAGLQTTTGHTISDRMIDYWDSIFNQDIVKPDRFHDPLQASYAPENKGVNPKQLRGESDFNFTQRVRQYGESRGRAEGLKTSIAEATRRAKEADRFTARMRAIVSEPTRHEVIANKLQDRAQTTLNKLAQTEADASGNAVPKMWRPLMEALDRVAEEAKKDPSLAPLLAEIPDNFEKALRFAAQIGFEPAYMPDMTWDMAARYMYGHLTLGTNAEESSMRKINKNVLNRAGITARSIEALGAGTVMAMRELLQSRLVQFVEENYARQWKAGVEIPDGWKPWSATRDAILTGRNVEGKTVAANDTLIVPDAVHDTIRKMAKAPVDMPFRNLWKGGPTAVWKNLILTYSPSWYIKHFIGSTTLAALEGVRLQDWRKAWEMFKRDELPDVLRGRTVYSALDMDTNSMIKRNRFKDFPDLVRAEGVRSAAHEFTAKLQNVVKTVDTLNRAAVYARAVRLTDNPAFAASRAVEALGDFGRLSPFERGAVSSVIPFYSFQKAMFRILLHLPIDHPLVTVISMQLGLMHQDYLRQKLGGDVPDAYASAIMSTDGKLTPMDKMNPLSDSYKLITPAGIAASLHPFIRPLAEDAFGGPSYGSGVGMSPTGTLQPSANIGQSYEDMYSSLPALGGNPVGVTSQLSEKQYQSLLKRIAKYSKARDAVDAGGYLVTDANKAKKADAAASQLYG
jgi:hypothetical protein